MTKNPPRVALFTDAFHEVDGVSHTCRNLAAFAAHRELPLMRVNSDKETKLETNGSVTSLGLARGRLAFKLDQELRYDVNIWRYREMVRQRVAEFRPDVVHITGPGDFGQIGMFAAKELKLPLVISYHTNLHEFGAQRLDKLLRFLPGRSPVVRAAERGALKAIIRFHKEASVLLAPNEELRAMLERATGIETFIMSRGIDTQLFSPARRSMSDGVFRFGYVGRLRPEKSVRFLVEVERAFIASGKGNFRFLIVGDGSEREWLEANMTRADFTGVLRGEALAEAYANMDLFLFPSRTDTFGNVVLEALASGVPAVVTDGGGPKFIVADGVNGVVTKTNDEFIKAVLALMNDATRRAAFRTEARRLAQESSWDAVFERVYDAYRIGIERFYARGSKPQRIEANRELSADYADSTD